MTHKLDDRQGGRMERRETLFFDLNGTLLDDSGNREAILRTCGEIASARPGLDAARLQEANGEIWQAYWPEVEDKWTLGLLDGASVSLEAWSRALRACGCDDDSLSRLARDTHRRHARDATRLFDDVQDLFAWLSRTRVRLALITNGASDTQRDALRTLGIEQIFSAVVISAEIGIAKPDPAIFAIAIDKLGVNPEHVWHVGDSLRSDVGGAKAAGLIAVWLNRGGLPRTEDEPLPDHEIRSLRELAELLSACM
jgi:putative hydrolase of the HAD superfamily